MSKDDHLRDPQGYAIPYAADGESFDVVRLADEKKIGNRKTRKAAVALAEKDIEQSVDAG